MSKIIVVEPRKEPRVVTLEMNGDAVFAEIRKLVEGDVQVTNISGKITKDRNLHVMFNEDGINKKLLTNRWGLLGTFVIAKMNTSSFGDFDTDKVMEALKDEDWLPVHLPERHRPFFFFRNGVPAKDFTGMWSADLNFTGEFWKGPSVFAIQRLIDQHVDHLVAYSVMTNQWMYVVELQFDETPAGRQQKNELQQKYAALFPDEPEEDDDVE